MSTDFLVDEKNWFDRFVMRTFAVVFQFAEILLVVGAFRYAGERSHSPMLTNISHLLAWVGAMWLGLLLPNTIGRLRWWRKMHPIVFWAATVGMLYVAGYGTYQYTQAIEALAKSNYDAPQATTPDAKAK